MTNKEYIEDLIKESKGEIDDLISSIEDYLSYISTGRYTFSHTFFDYARMLEKACRECMLLEQILDRMNTDIE